MEVLLWEGDAEAAWREACEGGCSSHLWMVLADRRQETHPDDALPVFQQAVDTLLQHAVPSYYEEAVAIVRKIGAAMRRLGRDGDFVAYRVHLAAKHRRKRNLMRLLETVR